MSSIKVQYEGREAQVEAGTPAVVALKKIDAEAARGAVAIRANDRVVDLLRPLTEELTAVLESIEKPYEILFVDDGSCDNGPRVLKELAAENGDVRVLTFEFNCGQSAAFDAGFRHAKGDVLVTMDADMQNDPNAIPKLLEKIDKYDMVCG